MKRIVELWKYRQMIIGLVRRELRGRYKGSVLGFLWTFINPLLQLVVYTFVFSIVMRANIEKYYLFLFVALIPWIFFSYSVSGGCNCILNHKDMVTKIYFPREVLPIAHVTTGFINMLYSFVVVLIVVYFSGIKISLSGFLCIPIVAIIEYLLCLGFTFFFSAMTVYLRDLDYIMGIIVMAWQFLTPVMYTIEQVPETLREIFNANPMTHIIIAYRDIFYYGKMPELETLKSATIWGVLLIVVGYAMFQKLQQRFAEEL